MCCLFCNSCCIVFACVFTIIQCTFQIIICIWMILLYKCKTTLFLSNRYTLLWYFTYFYKNECSTENLISYLADNDSYNLTEIFELPEISSHAESTYKYILTITLLDSIWILTAIILLVSFCTNSKKYKGCFIFPWLVCCLTICSLDVFLTYTYAKHTELTGSVEDWLNFIGATKLKEYEFPKSEIFKLPPILMSLFFGRIVIIWFINLVLFVILLVVSCKFCCKKSISRRNSQQHSYPQEQEQRQLQTNAPRPIVHGKEEEVIETEVRYIYPHKNSDKISAASKNFAPGLGVESMNDSSNEARIKRWQMYYGSDALNFKVKTNTLVDGNHKNINKSSEDIKAKKQKRHLINNKEERNYNQKGYFDNLSNQFCSEGHVDDFEHYNNGRKRNNYQATRENNFSNALHYDKHNNMSYSRPTPTASAIYFPYPNYKINKS